MAVTHGLTHPTDLAAWQRWQDRQSPLRAVRRLARGAWRELPLTLTGLADGPRPDVLVTIETRSASSVLALLHPLRHLDLTRVVVASPMPVTDLLPPGTWVTREAGNAELAQIARTVGIVMGTGHYLRIGGISYAAARPKVPFVTVQHGLLTPHTPPLASGTTLLAWSEADAAFWRSGRRDVCTEVLGSQLLWHAAQEPQVKVDPDARPVWLGQLHGADLDRQAMARSAEEFCLREGATYRPHPSERDRRSLAQHRRWEAMGITIDRSGFPLTQLRAPVVSAFSTGVIEAAARGLPAWASFADPPAWLRDFWERGGMSVWGEPPTPPPAVPSVEPAAAVAHVVLDLAGDRR